MFWYYLVVMLALGLANLYFSIMILRGLAEEGVKVSFFEIRWQVHKHLKTYKKLHLEKTGKIPFPYFGYLLTLGGLVLHLTILLVCIPI